MTEKLAVLIDGETVPATIAQDLFEEIEEIGIAVVKRIYGDSHYNYAWKGLLGRYALRAVPPIGNTDGRGATCSTLIIDAMDMLYSGRYDAFCIVTNSNDFTGLAMRIREDGFAVHGFGDERVAGFFKNACDSFSATSSFSYDAATATPYRRSEGRVMRDGQNYFPFVKFLDKAIYAQQEETDGPVLLSKIGATLLRIDPTFDPKRYGYDHLIDMFKAVPTRYRLSGEGGTLAVQITKNKPMDSLGSFGDSDNEMDDEEIVGEDQPVEEA